MARPSAASLAVAPLVEVGKRLEPPEGLTKAERELWTKIVDEKPADWFRQESVELLKVYCRCSVMLAWLGDKIASTMQVIDGSEDRVDENGLPDLEAMGAALQNLTKFQQMEDKYAKNLMAVATKLRLTPQSQIAAPTAGGQSRKAATDKVWEADTPVEDLYAPLPDDEGAGVSLPN